MNIGQLTATLGIDTKGLNQARQDMKKFEQDLTRMGESMTKVGRKMAMFVTLPILAAGTASTKMQMEFEASMTKITSLVGISRDQMQKWSKEVIKMAPALGKSPAELADALFFITSAGIKGADAMKVLTSSAKASSVGLGETKIVADLVTSAMNAYGKENLSAAKATDILVATVREGKAEAPELAAALGQVLPVASAMEVSFNQVGAAVAAMTRTGTNAATASMQLRQIMASLLKPTKMANDAFESMGTSAGILRQQIKDKGLLSVLSTLKDLTNTYGEEIMANVFPNIRALSGVLDLMGSNVEDNVAIFERMKETTGDLDKAYLETTKTLKHKYDVAVSSVKTAMTEFGNILREFILPLLEKFSKKIQSLINWIQGLTDRQKKLVVTVGLVVSAIGPLLLIIGNLLIIIPKLVIAFKLMKVAIAANPILVTVDTGI